MASSNKSKEARQGSPLVITCGGRQAALRINTMMLFAL
jgi:hypothetical protein